MPERGARSRTLFLKDVNFDPVGQDSWRCSEDAVSDQRAAYTFTGSYYHVYVQMAHCEPQTGSLLLNALFTIL